MQSPAEDGSRAGPHGAIAFMWPGPPAAREPLCLRCQSCISKHKTLIITEADNEIISFLLFIFHCATVAESTGNSDK